MIVVMSLSTVCKSPDKVRSSIKPILTDECSFSRSGCIASQNSIIITLVTCELHLRVSQGTLATFYRCGGQSYNRLFPIFSGFYVPKRIKICSLLTELLKI